MKDNGTVISTEGDLAQVKVSCFQACDECSAHSLCIGPAKTKGQLLVKNPLNASPGDKVRIEVPEQNYTRALIIIFGGLLTAALVGMGVGYLFSGLTPLSLQQSSILGFFLGIGLITLGLFRYFRTINKIKMYPRIIAISKKGD
jgi:positive regulator of sigma E activity